MREVAGPPVQSNNNIQRGMLAMVHRNRQRQAEEIQAEKEKLIKEFSKMMPELVYLPSELSKSMMSKNGSKYIDDNICSICFEEFNKQIKVR
jgi:F0F1-type ATP synthase membrane subunit b/b'